MTPPLRLMSYALVLSLLGGCAMAREALSGSKKPSARVVSVRPENLRLDGMDLALEVEVTNPYDVDLPILGLDFGVASEGKSFLKGHLPAGGTIARGGSRVLPVRAQVTFADLLSILGDVKPGAVVPYDLDAAVTVDAPVVGSITLPVKHRGELPIPTIPDVSLASVKFGTLRPNEVKAVLAIDVVNGNAFALSAIAMDFGLSLGGKRILETKSPSATSLGAGKSERIEIPVSFSPLSAGLATYSMLTGSGASYGLDGSMSVTTPFGDLSMPLDVAGETSFTK